MENKEKNSSFMHSFTEKETKSSPAKYIVIFLIIALVGVGSGYALTLFKTEGGSSVIPLPVNSSVTKGKIYGSNDTKTFKDTVEGEVKEGGIEGEGQFHLVRPGGDSQNVYMTSSLVDLSVFVGKKVKVWGQTQAAQKAGWLMDVGRVEVLE